MKEKTTEIGKQSVLIAAPKFQTAVFKVKGTVPLVIHRFSEKVKKQMLEKMEAGKTAGSRKNREPKKTEDTFNEARYISKEGWDGFNASAIRKAMISACRLVNFKMTLAKLSVFVVQDGWDAKEPQIPLIRIYAKPVMQTDPAVTSTGERYITVRPAYHDWTANIKIRWDADQFTITDVYNLLNRVGNQVGICEGRHDSKNSAGMGWGLFEVEEGAKMYV